MIQETLISCITKNNRLIMKATIIFNINRSWRPNRPNKEQKLPWLRRFISRLVSCVNCCESTVKVSERNKYPWLGSFSKFELRPGNEPYLLMQTMNQKSCERIRSVSGNLYSSRKTRDLLCSYIVMFIVSFIFVKCWKELPCVLRCMMLKISWRNVRRLP